MKKIIRGAVLALSLAALSLPFLGCAKKSAVKTIIVGTGKSYEPFCYLDDDGKLAGYEKEVLDAVDELLPQYTFSYETFDFANILISLQTGKVDIGSHQFGRTPQREENYLFGSQSYRAAVNRIIVLKTNDEIRTLEDLQGKTVKSGIGDLVTEFLKRYNETLPDEKKINVVPVSSDAPVEQTIVNMKNGTYAAFFDHNPAVVEKYNREYGDLFKEVGPLSPETSTFTYHVYRKGDEELRDAVDGALRTLIQNGKLREISTRILGYDVTPDL